MTHFPISPEQDEAQFQAIVERFAEHLAASPMPAFHLIVGQPGAGKTELIEMVKETVRDNILVCNADELRNFHPQYDVIMRDHEPEATDITWPAATDWNKRLIEYGVIKGFNILVETTGKDLPLILKTLEEKKAMGYINHAHIMAIPKRFSWLGIHLRYERLKERNQYGRITKESEHDERFDKLCENVAGIVNSEHVDHVVVYTRRPLMKLDQACPVVPLTATTGTAILAFREAVEKKMGLDDRTSFYEVSSRITELMRQRGAPSMDIEAFEEKAQKLGAEE